MVVFDNPTYLVVSIYLSFTVYIISHIKINSIGNQEYFYNKILLYMYNNYKDSKYYSVWYV